MATSTNSYYCSRLGITLKNGDVFIMNGNGYSSAYAESVSVTFNNEEAIFYGVYTDPNEQQVATLITRNPYSNTPNYYFKDEAIVCLKENTVSYNANGGSGAPSAQTKVYGSTLTLSSTKPTKSGYEFAGWGTSASDTSVDYNAGGSYTKNASITLYAIWKKTITLSYNANGGSGAPSSQSATVYNATTSNKFTISSTKPTRTGYTFLGWSTSNTATSASYSSGGSINLSSSTTLYAVWTEHYLTINYYSNYATAYSGTSEYPALNTVNNNNVLVFTKEYKYSGNHSNGILNYKETGSSLYMYRIGYTATGDWGTSTSGGTLVDQDDTSLNTGQKIAQAFGKDLSSGNASINVYAQWKENGLTVDYYSNYADYGTYQGDPLDVSSTSNVLVYSKTYYYDDAYEDGLNDIQNENYLYLSRTGYFSTGQWGTTSSGGILVDEKDSFTTGQVLAEIFGLSLENGNESIVVYAQWEPANVGYYNNNGNYVLCNTYGKVDGKWQPMLLYGKINGAWVRSVTDE